MTSPSSRHETGCSKPEHWDNPERWDGEGGRRCVRVGGHMYTHGRFMSIYGKNHHNIVKLLASNLKKKKIFKKFMAQILAAPLGIEILPPNSRWRSVTRGGACRPRAAGPAQLCPLRCHPVDWSSGSSVHGILRARILEWIGHFLLQEIFLTQGLNWHLLHWQADSLPPSHLRTPLFKEEKATVLAPLLLEDRYYSSGDLPDALSFTRWHHSLSPRPLNTTLCLAACTPSRASQACLGGFWVFSFLMCPIPRCLINSCLTTPQDMIGNTMLLLSHFNRVWLCATPALGFSRQEYWSGLPFPSPVHKSEKWKWCLSVMSESSRAHGVQPTRLLHPWDSPGEYWSGVPLLSPRKYRKCIQFSCSSASQSQRIKCLEGKSSAPEERGLAGFREWSELISLLHTCTHTHAHSLSLSHIQIQFLSPSLSSSSLFQ